MYVARGLRLTALGVKNHEIALGDLTLACEAPAPNHLAQTTTKKRRDHQNGWKHWGSRSCGPLQACFSHTFSGEDTDLMFFSHPGQYASNYVQHASRFDAS